MYPGVIISKLILVEKYQILLIIGLVTLCHVGLTASLLNVCYVRGKPAFLHTLLVCFGCIRQVTRYDQQSNPQ